MRQWMVDPKILCRKHLLGEHVECHMSVGSFKKKKKIDKYIAFNLMEPKSIKNRHDALAKEINERGYNHHSNLDDYDLTYLPEEQQNYIINKEKALNDLLSRCEECGKRYYELKNK